MINLRYHIVSLTAVFLAIGIGLTLGSTFLDRATVENLNGQLENLEARLGERDEQIGELQDAVDRNRALQEALDEQGTGLLAGRLDPVPVVVLAAEGVDEADVDGAVRSLAVAGADVQGLWWLSDRFLLASDGDVTDLATALDEGSADPARLRRMALATLGDELRARQEEEPELPVDEGDGADDGEGTGGGTEQPGDLPAVPEDPADPTGEGAGAGADEEAGLDSASAAQQQDDPADDDLGDVQALFDAGFLVFEPVADGPEAPQLLPGVRVIVVGGSPAVPDDVVLAPLLSRLTDGTDEPTTTIVTSALGDGAEVSEVVATIRADERLRSVVSTVDDLDHFQGWMATVLAVEDVGEGIIGHYGLGEGASALLPPLQEP